MRSDQFHFMLFINDPEDIWYAEEKLVKINHVQHLMIIDMHLVLRILYVFEGEPAPFEEKKPAVESMSLPLLFCNGINVIVFLLYSLSKDCLHNIRIKKSEVNSLLSNVPVDVVHSQTYSLLGRTNGC